MQRRASAPGSDDRGAALIEYALLIALIAVVCVLTITYLGREISQGFSQTGSGFGP
jgi:pilus assembly protein Flp/PilA